MGEHDEGKKAQRSESAPNQLLLAVNELSRIFHKEMRKVCEENGVPVGYRSLLFHLMHHNGCSQKELSDHTKLKAATVSITLEKMERDGYIQRKKDESDGRAVKVYLTEKGIDIDRKNKEKLDELEKQLCSYIDKEAEEQAAQILNTIIKGYCVDRSLPYPPLPPDCKETDKKIQKA